MPSWSTPILDANGKQIGIACSRGPVKSCKCGRRSTKLCDYPLRGKKQGKTCDAPLCDRCATSVGKNLDYCCVHAEIAKKETP